MSNRRTEESVRRAFGNAAPNNLKEVMGKCEEQKGRVIILENTAKKKSGRVFSRVMAAAAALVLIVTGTYLYGANHSVASTVALDVNPSIELGVNKKEQVVLVTPKNEDGVKVIGDMKLKGSDLKVAVNAIIGSMLREGYISEMANSILISVDSDDPIKSAEMQNRLSAEVKDMLDTGSFKGAVLSQTISDDPDTKRLAEQYGITEGKAQLIKQITENNAAHTFDELAGLSVNELNLIGESGSKSITNVTAEGAASDSAYIGEAKAKEIALAHAGAKAEEILGYEFEMDYEHGAMIYELEFDWNGREYEYDINANTGEILKYDGEPAENTKGGKKQETPKDNVQTASDTPGQSTGKRGRKPKAKAEQKEVSNEAVNPAPQEAAKEVKQAPATEQKVQTESKPETSAGSEVPTAAEQGNGMRPKRNRIKNRPENAAPVESETVKPQEKAVAETVEQPSGVQPQDKPEQQNNFSQQQFQRNFQQRKGQPQGQPQRPPQPKIEF